MFAIFLLIILIAFIVFFIYVIIDDGKDRKIFLTRIDDVKSENEFVKTSEIPPIFMGVSERDQLLFILFQKNDAPIKIPFTSLRGCNMSVDGETIQSKSTSSMLGRAIVGGILTGGVGAVVGAATATSNSKETIKSIAIQILTSDIQNPMLNIYLYPNNVRDVYDAKRIANEWTQIIQILASRNA
jgi:hypothetical protein